MPDQPFSQNMKHELRRRGLPPRYVERVVRELDDHRIDMVDRARSGRAQRADNRLGDPAVLADALAAQYRARGFCGRHPVIAFLVAPIPTVVGLWAALLLAVIGAMRLVELALGFLYSGNSAHPSVLALAPLLLVGMVVVPPALAAATLTHLAYRSGRSWGWAIAASALVAVAATAFHHSVQYPTAPGTGRYLIALGLSARTFISTAGLQGLVPLLVAALAIVRHERREQRPVEVA